MRRFSVALLVLIVLGIIMTLQREEPGGPVSVADTVQEKVAPPPAKNEKSTAATANTADTKALASRKGRETHAVAHHERPASTAAATDPAHETTAAQPPKPVAQRADAGAASKPPAKGGHAASRITSSADATKDVVATGAASGSVAKGGKAPGGGEATDSAAYLPPWDRKTSRSADAEADGASETKSRRSAAAAPPRHVIRKAERNRSRSRSFYRTAPTSSYGNWDEHDRGWRRHRPRRGKCYFARDGVLECDRGRVYFRR